MDLLIIFSSSHTVTKHNHHLHHRHLILDNKDGQGTRARTDEGKDGLGQVRTMEDDHDDGESPRKEGEVSFFYFIYSNEILAFMGPTQANAGPGQPKKVNAGPRRPT